MKKVFLIKDDFINSRLDKWFKKNVCDVPQSLIEKSIRKGKIKINSKKKKSSYKIQKNDQISIYNFDFFKKPRKKILKNYIPSKKDVSSTSNFIIEDNENFSVINKPQGISVQSGTKSRKNILDILKYSNEFKNHKPYCVHRIDKDTSGALIVAKNREYAQLFTSLFRIRKIHKTYLAIVIGQFEKSKGTLKDTLFHYEGNKKIFNNAITHFNVVDSNNNYTLLRLNPETGRKHQLRQQLLIHGHPILGDKKYRLKNIDDKKNSNLMLHSYKIHFLISNMKYNFTAKPNSLFLKALKEKYLKIY